jgi:hypothetical protein
MLFAQETVSDWKSALALLVVIAANVAANWWQNRKPRQLVVRAADKAEKAVVKAEETAVKAEHAATAAEAQATLVNEKIDGVHATLNGNGILGTLRKIDARLVAHEADDKAHFAKTDETLGAVVQEVKDIHTKAAIVAAAVQRGIVIQPTKPEAH